MYLFQVKITRNIFLYFVLVNRVRFLPEKNRDLLQSNVICQGSHVRCILFNSFSCKTCKIFVLNALTFGTK